MGDFKTIITSHYQLVIYNIKIEFLSAIYRCSVHANTPNSQEWREVAVLAGYKKLHKENMG